MECNTKNKRGQKGQEARDQHNNEAAKRREELIPPRPISVCPRMCPPFCPHPVHPYFYRNARCFSYRPTGYFPPGCYRVPTTPYQITTCKSTKPYQYTLCWKPRTPATYVVDKYGVVHYASDLEYQVCLVLPWSRYRLNRPPMLQPVIKAPKAAD